MSRFLDVPDSHPNVVAIEKMAEAGIIVGVGGKKFAPSEVLTDDQVRTIITRMFKLDLANRTRAEVAQILASFLEDTSAPPPTEMKVFPVKGAKARDFVDTWGAPRPGGRQHKGVDIFAKSGTPLLACVDGVIDGSFGDVRPGDFEGPLPYSSSQIGGLRLWIRRDGGPGPEWYYAHLQGFAPNIRPGTHVNVGDVVGYCDQTGDARFTPPHLHLGWDPKGTSGNNWANPYKLLRKLLPL